MGRLTGRIIDKATGEPVEARVQVIGPNGNFSHPSDALLKVGTGAPFFYSDGTFDLNVGRGKVRVVAERGTEYVPAEITVDAPLQGTAAVELELERWAELGEQGWHPGNTHIHYDEKEQRPDDRLSLDPRVEDLRMTAISILKRWELEYATNKYAPGFLNEFSSTHYYVQCGEENRHNALGSHSIGYGHVMFLNIRNVRAPRQPRPPCGRIRPRLPPAVLRLRRHSPSERRRHMVPQRAGDGSARRSGPRKARRLQPLRSPVDGPRVRHLLPDAQRGHQAPCLYRLRLVRQLGEPGLRRYGPRLRLRRLAHGAQAGQDLHHQRACPPAHRGRSGARR